MEGDELMKVDKAIAEHGKLSDMTDAQKKKLDKNVLAWMEEDERDANWSPESEPPSEESDDEDYDQHI